jgi:hypothetical protein
MLDNSRQTTYAAGVANGGQTTMTDPKPAHTPAPCNVAEGDAAVILYRPAFGDYGATAEG